MDRIVNIHEAKNHFSKLLKRVMSGERIIIAKAGQPMAVLSPFTGSAPQRIPGMDKGKRWQEKG